jgi:NADPH-dependent 2,4-dienoyl-CoA reductase/sulfur reductase-like enzyme
MHYVIVGNSIAGVEAALTLRRRDESARITVVSSESAHPFARTAMMYVFCGQLRLQDTEFVDRGTWDRMRVKAVHDRVVRVDAAEHRVVLERGAPIHYDRLLLAVGSVARRLPYPGAYDGTGVHHYVTLADHDGLDAAAKKGMRAAVIGGGLIGVEVTEVLHLRGLRTHWLVREAWTWPVALDRGEAAVVEAHVAHHGVDVRTGFSVSQLERVGDHIRLSSGGQSLDVDLVIGAIGVMPNTAFLVGSDVALGPDGSILTGDDLQSTSAPDVFAAGDCACVTWADGARRPETLWYTGRDQGRAAAAAMVGDAVRYRRGTWYNSAKFFDLEYTTAGYVPVAESERRAPTPGRWQTWFQRHPEESASLRIVVKDDRVVGFNALGRRWSTEVWLRWIQERRALPWVLAHLQDSTFDEEFTPPFPVLDTAILEEGA